MYNTYMNHSASVAYDFDTEREICGQCYGKITSCPCCGETVHESDIVIFNGTRMCDGCEYIELKREKRALDK